MDPLDGAAGPPCLPHPERQDGASPLDERILWETERWAATLAPTALPGRFAPIPLPQPTAVRSCGPPGGLPCPLALGSRQGREEDHEPTASLLMEAFVSRTSGWSRHQTGLRSDRRKKGLWYDVHACRERTIREGSERVALGNVLRNSLITEDWTPRGAPVLFLSVRVPDMLCREGG